MVHDLIRDQTLGQWIMTVKAFRTTRTLEMTTRRAQKSEYRARDKGPARALKVDQRSRSNFGWKRKRASVLDNQYVLDCHAGLGSGALEAELELLDVSLL
jgi:hypothetical protein